MDTSLSLEDLYGQLLLEALDPNVQYNRGLRNRMTPTSGGVDPKLAQLQKKYAAQQPPKAQPQPQQEPDDEELELPEDIDREYAKKTVEIGKVFRIIEVILTGAKKGILNKSIAIGNRVALGTGAKLLIQAFAAYKEYQSHENLSAIEKGLNLLFVENNVFEQILAVGPELLTIGGSLFFVKVVKAIKRMFISHQIDKLNPLRSSKDMDAQEKYLAQLKAKEAKLKRR